MKKKRNGEGLPTGFRISADDLREAGKHEQREGPINHNQHDRIIEQTASCRRVSDRARQNLVPAQDELQQVRVGLMNAERWQRELDADTCPIRDLNDVTALSREAHRAVSALAALFNFSLVELIEDATRGESLVWADLAARAELAERRRGRGAADAATAADRSPQPSQPRPSLDPAQFDILMVLAKARGTLHQVDLTDGSGHSSRTVKGRLPGLEAQGLVHRPHGERRGYAITPKGLALIPSV